MSAAPSTAEALGFAGFDFLVVDMEHVPVDTPQMIEILRTLEGTPAPGVVRLPWNDMVMVKRALDGGANRGGTELRCGEALQLSLKAAHRGARGGNDDDRVGHAGFLLRGLGTHASSALRAAS